MGQFVYYGVLREILKVHFLGMLDIICIVFFYDWYDPFGITSVIQGRDFRSTIHLSFKSRKVCYIRYPQVKNKKDPWITGTEINPRVMVHGVSYHDPLQQSYIGFIGEIDNSP